MKVAIRDLKPNPFRHLESYPIDQAKVDRLRKSFKHTGFWDNLVARNNKGKIEIAYGHHRLAALKKEYPAKYEVSVIIKPLDDAYMIKVMADENDEIYNLNPAVINETIKAARDFLKTHPEELAKVSLGKRAKDGEEYPIRVFLGWENHKERVQNALAALSDIYDDKIIDKEVYESFSTQSSANEFRKAVKKSNIPKEAHARLAKKLQNPQREKKTIRKAVLEEKYKKDSKERRRIEINDLVQQLTDDLNHAALLMDKKFVKYWKHADEDRQQNLMVAFRNFISQFSKIKKGKTNARISYR